MTLGRCTFLGLQERGSLSTFFTIYPFIRKNYLAREELVCFFGLDFFFLLSSWRFLRSPLVAAFDASPSGHAVCAGQWPQQKAAQHGRVLERNRFKRNPGASAHDSFFQANDFVKRADGAHFKTHS